MEKLTQNSNFSIFHDLQSDLKVSEMGWKVKNILRGQSKHGLWGCNLKTGNFLPGSAQEQICRTVFGTMPSLQPPSGGFEQAPSDIDRLGPQIPNV